ncbi:golvesin C-terminal-like domain-containing protein [Streptomyces lunaelactis]|uniref:golvesin C-terminal-like domain-containing protein n=1 Tax=Streptomyces lunaelactis TaxID=1535768 RepID=UPI001C30D11B
MREEGCPRKGIVKVRLGRFISCLVVSAVAGTALPQVAYAAPASKDDDGKGVFDTFKGWFSDDDERELAKPPVGGKLAVPSREKLPKGKKLPKAKRVKELTGKRSGSARFWQMSDGRVQAELSAVPTSYKAGKSGNSWKPIDTAVRATDKKGFDFTNGSNTATSWFGSDAGRILRFEAGDGRTVTFGLEGAAKSSLKPTAKGDTVTYKDAMSGADLTYQVGPGRVKENIVLGERPDGAVSFTFSLDTDGLTPRTAKDGSIGFYSEASRFPVMTIPAPYMTDAKKAKSSPYGHAYSSNVTQKLVRDGKGWKLRVTPDAKWLAAKERQYPVAIDPTITIMPGSATSQDVMVRSDTPTTNYNSTWDLSAGKTSSTAMARSLLRFPLDEIPAGTKIDAARLGVYYDQVHTSGSSKVTIGAYRATGPWTEAQANWSNTSALVGEQSGTTVLMDDGDAGTAAVGEWPTGSTTGGAATNDDFAYNKNTATGETYTWQPNVPETDSYRTDVHYPAAADAATAAPYTVNYSGGSKNYTVNQTGTGGVWKTLESVEYPWAKGTAGKIVLGDTGSSSTRTLADSVRLVNPAAKTKGVGEYSQWHDFPVTDTVQKWASGTAANNGFILKAVDETSTAPLGGPQYEAGENFYGGEVSSYPRLTVTYGKVGTALDSPTVVHSTGPELSWPHYTNSTGSPSNDIVEYQLHRSTQQVFTPSAATLVAPIASTATTYTDTTAVPTPDSSSSEIGKSNYYQLAVKTKAGEVLGSPTRVVGIPKAGRTMKIIQANPKNSVNPTDTTLSSASPTTNWNKLVQAGVGQSWLSVGNNSATYDKTRSVLKFPTSDIPTTATILDNKLYMWGTLTSQVPGSAIYELHSLTQDFTETTATWNNANATTPWTTAGGDMSATVADTVANINTDLGRHWWGATGLMQSWVRTPANNKGVALRLKDESLTGPQERSLFLSSEAQDVQMRPYMQVIYVDSTTEDTYYAPQTPARMTPNSTYTVEMTVTNTTSAAWAAGERQMSYTWKLPDGTDVTTGGNQASTAIPALLPGKSATIQAQVKTPINSDSGNKRNDYVLGWDVRKIADGSWLSAGTGGIPPLKQNVAVEDPTSNQIGLEKFYSYAGKNTGAGSSVMNNTASGNSVWSYNAFSNPGRGLNTFARLAYNSLDTSDTVLGAGWSGQAAGPIRMGAPLVFHPKPSPTEVTLPDGDGTTHTFRKQPDGSWKAPAGVHYKLAPKVALDCTPAKDPIPDAWTMTRPDGTRFLFGCDGYLTSVIDKNGNTQSFTYEERKSNNKPVKFLKYVTDPAGRQTLTVDYFKKGDATYEYINDSGAKVSGTNLTNTKIYDHVKSMTDISGRKIALYYTTEGLLGQFTDGEGSTNGAPKVFKFTYDATQGKKNVKLVKATDPRGNATDLAYYYPKEGDDPKYHWWTQTITDRKRFNTDFVYKPNAANSKFTDTKVTDAEAHATDYVTDDFGRPVQITNAKSETTKTSWDADNNVTYLEEANGAKTAFCFDQKTGYPVWQRDAENNKAGVPPQSDCAPGTYPANAAKYEYQTRLDGYSADIFRKTSPEGRTHQFAYDTFGNLKAVTDPKGVASATADDYTTKYEYNSHGQLTKAIDANGNPTINSGFEPTGYPKTITDALSKDSTFVYDERGQVLESVNAKGAKTTQAYDTFGRPLEQKAPKSAADNKYITVPAPTYDANDNVTKVISPSGAVSTSVFDAADQITESVAPGDEAGAPGRKTTRTYDKVGNALSVTEPKGNEAGAAAGSYTTTMSYDEIYQVTRTTNVDGASAVAVYDNVGNAVKLIDPKKNATADPDDFTSKTAYDLSHRPYEVTDAAGKTASTKYDKDSLTVSSTDAENNETLLTYDERGALAEQKVPHSKDGSGTITYRTTKFEYDQVGNRTKVTSPRGVETTSDATDYVAESKYDELNRVKEQLTPFKAGDTDSGSPDKTFYFYDEVGQLERLSAPPSQGQTVRNDTKYSYYDNGWTKSSTDPFDISTTYDYNDLGQQTKNTLTSAGGSSQRTMTWDFSPSGNQKARSDDGVPVGKQVALVDSTDVNNTATQGNWDASQATGQWGYDVRTHAKGDGTAQFVWQLNIPQDGSYEVFVRHGDVTGAASDASFKVTHATGDVTKTVDQSTRSNEWISLGSYSFTEAAAQKITLTDAANGTVVADAVKLVRSNTGETDNEKKDFTYRYDANANLVEVKDLAAGAKIDSYAIAYDGLNQLSKVEEKTGSTVKNTTALSYDINGNITSSTHDLTWSKIEYDIRDKISKVTNADSPTAGNQQIFTQTYTDRNQPLKQTKANGNTVDFTYFLDGPARSVLEKTSAGAVVAQHDLEYDPNGNRSKDTAKVMNADNTSAHLNTVTSFDYDPQDRIRTVTRTGDGAGTEEYHYDGNSNVVDQTIDEVSTSSTYDRNRLLKNTTGGVSATYNYDPLGRLDTVSSNGSTQEKYTYDGFDRMAKHTAGTGASAKTTSYVYDAFDRTQSETTSGTNGKTTAFTYLGMDSKVLREEVAGKATKSYQWSPWGQQLTQIKHKDDDSKEYSQYTYHPKGDVEGITKDDGTTRATYGYTAYGSDESKLFTGADKPDAQNPEAEPYNEYRYNGKRYDGASGTYDMGFRNYDPGLNRFLTRDMYNGALADMTLASDPYTGNRYAFAGGNPISFVELDGHLFGVDISISDIGHAVLDVAGQVPVIGEIADGANAIWYAAEGNWVDAGLSAAGMIPFAGSAVTGARLASKTVKAVDAIADGAKAADNVADTAKAADTATDAAKAAPPAPKEAPAAPKEAPAAKTQEAPSCTNSFVPGTKVVMADGSTKNIEDLKTGQQVLATDPETGDTRAREVTNTRSHKSDKHLVTLTVDPDGKAKPGKLTSTAAHLFWLPDAGKWVKAEQLKPGMWLQTSSGTWIQITAIDDSHRSERVHNLSVDGVHTYYVVAGTTPVLVHNCGRVDYGGNDLSQAVIQERLRTGNKLNNFAAVRYTDADGASQIAVAFSSKGPGNHAERKLLRDYGDSITEAYSEFQPCTGSNKCRSRLAEAGIPTTWTWGWTTSAEGSAARPAKGKAVTSMFRDAISGNW